MFFSRHEPLSKDELLAIRQQEQLQNAQEQITHNHFAQMFTSKRLDWVLEYENGPIKAQCGDLIAYAFEMPFGLGCRWLIRPDSHKQGLTLPDIVAGRCGSITDAVAAATNAMTLLVREAQE